MYSKTHTLPTRLIIVLMFIALACVLACSGKTSGGVAAKGTSSGIPAAAPRALGPGAASLDFPSQDEPPEPPEEPVDEDPFLPFEDPPDGGMGEPLGEPLPL